MRRLVVLSAVLLTVVLSGRADDSDDNPFSSAGPLDGRARLKSSPPGKLMYVRGLYDVVVIAPMYISAKGGNDYTAALEEFKLTGFSFGEIEAALDTFYENPSNIRVPILFALKWVKLRGDEREREATRLRSIFPKDGKPK